MKSILTILLVFTISISVKSQTVSMDFTRTDCDNVMHNLYSELDSGNVVVLNFIMLNCTPCVSATAYLEQIYNDYKTSHPGKVRVYTFGYLSNYTCKNITIWSNTYGFTMPRFSDGSAQVEYYGGMGMPTIVVTGGKNHKVFYKKLGFVESDYNVIKDSINSALSSTNINEYIFDSNIKIYPTILNDVKTINIETDFKDIQSIELYNAIGTLIDDYKVNNYLKSTSIDLNNVRKGIYYIKILKNGKVFTKKIIVQ